MSCVERYGLNRPNNLTILAGILEVPLAWLNCGGAANLPANSHIGVRLGDEAKYCREKLYGLTTQLMLNLNEDMTESQMQSHLDHVVMSRPGLAIVARRAGGALAIAAWSTAICTVDLYPRAGWTCQTFLVR
jgi:hypothetical protein